jgi:[ribosomal protein S5]-alanine N-acetyltransferase
MLAHKGTIAIETPRLTLRPFAAEDAEDMFANWCNDPEVTRYLSWKPHGDIGVTRGVLNQWIADYANPEKYHWAIVPKEINQVIGSISGMEVSNAHLRCEIGYCIGKAHWNKGYMTEALKAVVSYLVREIGCIRVQAFHYAANPASGKVMLKAGMSYEGRLRSFHLDGRGLPVDCLMYSILREELV